MRTTILSYRGKTFHSVLIRGETGAGKELAAAAVRACSSWASGRFEIISAPAVPPDQLESELFGTVRGAFTGAVDRRGLVEDLDGGALFIDEIAAMRLDHQAKLLRFIDCGAGRRLGSNRTYRVRLGLLAATNEDLEAKTASGEFREDLYYRLVQDGVVWVPPLRERMTDIALIAESFLSELGTAHALDPSAIAALNEHRWPGNVRELRAVCRCLTRRPSDGPIDGEAVWWAIDQLRCDRKRSEPVSSERESPAHGDVSAPSLGGRLGFQEATEAFQREMLLRALEKSGGNKTGAGVLLGFDRSPSGRQPSTEHQARKLAHHRFTYWYQRLVAELAAKEDAGAPGRRYGQLAVDRSPQLDQML
jgi:DNA-binding NtrC family response regulator